MRGKRAIIRSVSLVGDLLEKSARATPATVEHHRGTGWWLRHTDNGAWWSGAVLAHGPVNDLEQRVDAAERFYAERDAVPRFQICPDCPGPLDQILAERGYRWDAAVLLLTAVATPDGGQGRTGSSVHVDDSLGPEWLAVLSSTNGPETDVERETHLLHGIDGPCAYVTVFIGPDPVGIGRAVVDGTWAGIFNVATTPQARRRGVGRQVLSALGSWAEKRAVPHLYLQVEHANEEACRFYNAAGFRQLAAYHYRVLDRVGERRRSGPA